MFLTDLYYSIRPFIPRAVQVAVRRQILRRRLPKYAHVWPIDERAGVPPDGWPGWPGGKKFAFVITHDVETGRGVQRCQRLAQIDHEFGFRSSFNFVAEDYAIPDGLRERLANDGFEIGVHGLVHKGNLYGSRKKFQKDARKINHYLRAWNASGFRTPSMFHNLEWVKDLNVDYDSSTFDTDPFEPQSDGLGTIFPQWIDSNGRGLLELPYTLPQDYTLFVLMKETNTDIWKSKLDWIAERGGMAMLLVHPDYMAFDGRPSVSEYPFGYYVEFLDYVRSHYGSECWHAQPRDVFGFWNESVRQQSAINSRIHLSTVPLMANTQKPTPRNLNHRSLRICMLSYSFYELDARVSRYAETLARRGDQVDVVSLRQEGQTEFGEIKGVNVFRIQKREHNEKGKLSFLVRLLKFLIKSSLFLSKKHRKEAYDLVHVHSVPDFEVFAAWLPKLFGSKVILDIHDIVPEFYSAKFGAGKDSLLYRMLKIIEKLSTYFADHVIISNHIWKETLRRSVEDDRCSVIMNYPDPATFYPRPRTRHDDKFIILYPGTLNWHQGLDIAVRAFAQAKQHIPNGYFHIYGKGDSRQSLEKMIQDLGLQDRVLVYDMVPKEQIADIMANADLGVVPKRNDSFGGEAFSTKILEFMLLGVPVLVSRTKIDRYYFDDSVVRFFEPEDEASLALAMVAMARDGELREALTLRAGNFVSTEYDWQRKKYIYLDIVDKLVGRNSSTV